MRLSYCLDRCVCLCVCVSGPTLGQSENCLDGRVVGSDAAIVLMACGCQGDGEISLHVTTEISHDARGESDVVELSLRVIPEKDNRCYTKPQKTGTLIV